MTNSFLDLHNARTHTLRAAEIARNIGDMEGMLFTSINIYQEYIANGELDVVEQKVLDYLQSATVPENRVHEFLKEQRPFLLFFRGDWTESLNAYHEILNDIQEGESLQRIADKRMQIAFAILEINRFGESYRLKEVENLFKKNLEGNLNPGRSNLGLASASIQQGKLKQAHDYLTKAKELTHKSRFIFPNYFFPWVEFELAFAEDRWDEAISISESQLETFQRGGYRYDSARHLINLGNALVGRNAPRDLNRARTIYQQSLDMFTEMGATGYVRVVEERLASLQ